MVCELELAGHCLTLRVLGQGQAFMLPRTPRPDWSVDDVATIPEGGFGIPIIRSVFPTVRLVARPGQFGIEMALTF